MQTPVQIDFQGMRGRPEVEASIEHHASGEGPQVAFNDPAVVQAGARAFSERGCVNCHGAPGVDWAKFADRWRAGYGPSMDKVCRGALPWMKLDALHRMILDDLIQEFGAPD